LFLLCCCLVCCITCFCSFPRCSFVFLNSVALSTSSSHL
jgi:hypothetical protein